MNYIHPRYPARPPVPYWQDETTHMITPDPMFIAQRGGVLGQLKPIPAQTPYTLHSKPIQAAPINTHGIAAFRQQDPHDRSFVSDLPHWQHGALPPYTACSLEKGHYKIHRRSGCNGFSFV